MPSSAKRASSLRPSPESPPSSAAPSANGVRLGEVSPAIRRPSSPEEVCRRDLVPERLGSFESEHQPDPLAALDRVEIAFVRTARTRSAFSRTAWWSAVTWRSASRRLPLRLELQLDEDRTDLKPDAAGFEQRQPRLREHVRLAEPVLAVARAPSHIGVGVREQPADYPCSDDRGRVHADVLRHQSRDGRGDRGGPASLASRGTVARSARPSAPIRPGGRGPRRSERRSCAAAPT